jgi:AdoMet-dependent rRNA methyltransferase SPB1
MQLQMTAPMDIGLELSDPTLAGEDIFDLGGAERDMRDAGAKRFAEGEAGETDDEGEKAGEESDEEALDSEEELERRTRALEGDMDELYMAYRERLTERDAKFKVKEARRKDKAREEEWRGFGKAGSSDEEASDAESEGGWDTVQKAKGRGDDESSDDSSEEDDAAPAAAGRKRSRPARDEGTGRKKARLVADLGASNVGPSGRAANVWFSQDVFGALDDVEVEDDEEDEEMKNVGEEDSDAAETVGAASWFYGLSR